MRCCLCHFIHFSMVLDDSVCPPNGCGCSSSGFLLVHGCIQHCWSLLKHSLMYCRISQMYTHDYHNYSLKDMVQTWYCINVYGYCRKFKLYSDRKEIHTNIWYIYIFIYMYVHETIFKLWHDMQHVKQFFLCRFWNRCQGGLCAPELFLHTRRSTAPGRNNSGTSTKGSKAFVNLETPWNSNPFGCIVYEWYDVLPQSVI